MSETVKLKIVSLQSQRARAIQLPSGETLYEFGSPRKKGTGGKYELRRLGKEAVVLADYGSSSVAIRGIDRDYDTLFQKKHSGMCVTWLQTQKILSNVNRPSRFQTMNNGEHKFERSSSLHTQLDLIQTLDRSTGPKMATFRPKKHGFFWRGTDRGYIKLYEVDDFLVDGREPSAFLDDCIIHFYAFLIVSTRGAGPEKQMAESMGVDEVAKPAEGEAQPAAGEGTGS